MTDSMLLKQRIKDSGYRISFVASKLGLTYAGFHKKVSNETDFKAKEIMMLCDLLNIDNDDRESIFFATDVDKISTKATP